MGLLLSTLFRELKSKPFFQDFLTKLESQEKICLLGTTGSFKRFLIALLSTRFSHGIVAVDPALFRLYRKELILWLGEKLFWREQERSSWLMQGGVFLLREELPLPDPEWVRQKSILLKPGMALHVDSFCEKLVEMGFSQKETEPYRFLRRGENVLIFFPEQTIHISLPFQHVEELTTWGDTRVPLRSFLLQPRAEAVPLNSPFACQPSFFAADGSFALPYGILFSPFASAEDPLSLPEMPRKYTSSFPFNARKFLAGMKPRTTCLWFTRETRQILSHKQDLPILPLYKFVEGARAIYLIEGTLQNAFQWGKWLTVLTDRELSPDPQPALREFEDGMSQRDIEQLKEGDYVVHIEHGIGQFKGFEDRAEKKYFRIGYAKNDELFVPIEKRKRLHLYISSSGGSPKLTRLGVGYWEKAKQRVKQETREVALQLLRIAAKRKSAAGWRFSVDGEWIVELQQSFAYEETADQKRAFEEIAQDMAKPCPMDRILLGDVGFGKTEIALRAALIAVQGGKQVALLCPTTVLAHQHYQTFSRRLRSFPVNLGILSRFVPMAKRKQTLVELKSQKIDILIGTHALLQEKVVFADLGLFIIDEEQRFGVLHKESIRDRFPQADVLTLTATPIPRTLYQGLTGLKDVSELRAPLPDRLPVKTEIISFAKSKIREAVVRELDRGGRVFFVVPKVAQMAALLPQLQEYLPGVKIGRAHGQMRAEAIEKAMIAFLEGETPFLLCTDIIENGLDIPEANTIFVYQAHRFGMAQLYQLRGRVGRSFYQAHCYLVLPEERLSQEAQARVAALLRYQDLGAGFSLAKQDLELRGAGNILGRKQSGFIDSLGLTLYLRLLKENLDDLKEDPALADQLSAK